MTFKISSSDGRGRRRTIYAGVRTAAKTAAKLARSGRTAIVSPQKGEDRAARMACNPTVSPRGGRVVADCTMTPAFKALLKRR